MKSNWATKLWIGYLLGILAIALLFVLTGLGIFGKLPDTAQLENPTANLASEIYSADSVMIGKYYIDNRTNVNFKDLATNTVDALISTEDERFYKHAGIDLVATFRAIVSLGKDGGGSTLTQQLAKNLFNERASNIIVRIKQKAQEYIIAVQLEKRYTKQEIIAQYLNTVDFINHAAGIHSAARVYFNKLPKDLKVEESAVLVGMLKAPYSYNPIQNPKDALARRNVVMMQMVKNNKLTQEEYNKLSAQPIKLDINPTTPNDGLAPYFRAVLGEELEKWAKENTKPDGKHYNIYKDGLKIYTTIDTRLQKYAEQAVKEHLTTYQGYFRGQYGGSDPWASKEGQKRWKVVLKRSDFYTDRKYNKKLSDKEINEELTKRRKMKIFTWKGNKDTTMTPQDSIKHMMMYLQAGFMAMDPETGYVKAWVGGADFNFFKFDHCNINTKRQVGSTFKPILYALAVDNGWNICMNIPCHSQTIYFGGNVWRIKGSGGYQTMKQCVAKSLNPCAAYLVKNLGPEALVEIAHRMGVSTDIPPYPAIALGASDLSLYEMMTVYSCFPNAGIRTKPIMCTRIEDHSGNIIQTFVTDFAEAFSDKTAYLTLQLLRGVVDPVNKGTAWRLRGSYGLGDMQMGGKTGTTNKNVDAWYMGVTPKLIAGVWVGNDEQFLRFRSTGLGQGASAAMPVWGKFFNKVINDPKYKYIKDAKFFTPSDTTLVDDPCGKKLRFIDGSNSSSENGTNFDQ